MRAVDSFPEAVVATPRAGTIDNLRDMVDKVRPVTTADERTLPLAEGLGELFEGGLRRGTIVVVNGEFGATSLALSLSAKATNSGLWLGCLNTPSLGWAAADELGVNLQRVAAIEVPSQRLSVAAAALVDVFDMVVCDMTQGFSHSESRKLVARARERGCVLMILGDPLAALLVARGSNSYGSNSYGSNNWPDAPDALLRVEEVSWSGLGNGRGRLRGRRLRVRVEGRRRLARSRSLEISIPESGEPLRVSFSDATALDGTSTPFRRPASGSTIERTAG